jgi:hypothetical protein
LIQAGRVAQLEADREELNKKIERFNVTVESLRNQIDLEQEKNRKLQEKSESSNTTSQSIFGRNTSNSVRKGLFRDNSINRNNSNSNNTITDSIPLVHTICELQRERKILKSKLMKEKLFTLINEITYVNKYIEKNSRSEDLDLFDDLKEDVEDMNENYKTIRKQLSCPIVYDITIDNYNYNRIKTSENNKLSKFRIDYLTNSDKILSVMFGDNCDKVFKEVIDNDISRYLLF